MIIYANFAHYNVNIRLQHQAPKMVIIVCIYFNGYPKIDHVNFISQNIGLNTLNNKPISKIT
ncbi:hypothetical protein UB37_09165 [Photobacterium iliopiscarium]|jgi:hypothetical protein|uniref:Uncharacterized protein n=1 Tax=Photobacterium iliopiscarium TaxID=56192 RepID=A0A0D8PTU5_9GAMM|nr:hypothetical protein UB38_08280 [Photobacterium iliopiscarium]KJG22341.1 hypothetical protein UB37_09165 [Photobacterium iliopiscarium]PST95886.1 hypothetical protein C9I87_07285 [Photobacterium iliopiscarium]PST99888.1 hypothetical protein C9I85_09970 [Photobacterium iliopiscarium]PSV85056.1 hypothetical protein C9J51_01905 [Photobacterium iliopiscarium]